MRGPRAGPRRSTTGRRRRRCVVVLLGGLAAVATILTSCFYRKEILTRWYSLLLKTDDSRLADYLRSGDPSRNAAVWGYLDSLIREFGLPDLETQRAKLTTFDRAVSAMSPGGEDAILRRMLEVAGESAIEKHLEERTASGDSSATRGYQRLRQRFDHVRSIEEGQGDTAPEEVLEAQRRGNEDFLVVAVCLLRNELLRAKAADSLAVAGSERALRCLASELLRACSLATGGTESRILRAELRLALVRAIGRISAQDVSTYDGSEAEGYRLLRRLVQ